MFELRRLLSHRNDYERVLQYRYSQDGQWSAWQNVPEAVNVLVNG